MVTQEDLIKIDFVKEAYHNTKDFVTFADTKANITLAIQSILISIGLGASLLSETFQKVHNFGNIVATLVFYSLIVLFSSFTICGILTSILVYRARLKPVRKKEKEREGLLFFEHIVKKKTADEYSKEIEKMKQEEIIKEFSLQTHSLALIADRKYRWVNISICLMVVNLFLAISLAVFSGVINIWI